MNGNLVTSSNTRTVLRYSWLSKNVFSQSVCSVGSPMRFPQSVRHRTHSRRSIALTRAESSSRGLSHGLGLGPAALSPASSVTARYGEPPWATLPQAAAPSCPATSCIIHRDSAYDIMPFRTLSSSNMDSDHLTASTHRPLSEHHLPLCGPVTLPLHTPIVPILFPACPGTGHMVDDQWIPGKWKSEYSS